MPENTVQLPPDLARHYDAHYFRTYNGAPYERSAIWLTAFAAMADAIVRDIRPRTVLDVGCAMGFLVEALRDRGVEAFGLDVSAYAIDHVRDDIKPYCRVASAIDPLPQKYDLIICQEVLEHLTPADAERAVAQMCEATDDLIFSSTPTGFGEDTHVNVRPPEYWAGLFADRGFVRDVDFQSASILAPWGYRVRRSLEPLPRVVGDYERRLWTITQENTALRARVLETKAMLAKQDEARPVTPQAQALERTVAEQREHLDALTDRIRYMSDRETQLRTMLHAAHAQLLARDEQLRLHTASNNDELQQVIADRTAWAERMVAEAEARGRIIEQQQAAIAELERVIAERTAWAERMVAEAEARGRIIAELSARQATGGVTGLLRRLRKSA
jgi:SAM-dependent methyltransferase